MIVTRAEIRYDLGGRPGTLWGFVWRTTPNEKGVTESKISSEILIEYSRSPEANHIAGPGLTHRGSRHLHRPIPSTAPAPCDKSHNKSVHTHFIIYFFQNLLTNPPESNIVTTVDISTLIK